MSLTPEGERFRKKFLNLSEAPLSFIVEPSAPVSDLDQVLARTLLAIAQRQLSTEAEAPAPVEVYSNSELIRRRQNEHSI